MKTDSQLQQDVMAELNWEPAVHAAQTQLALHHSFGAELQDLRGLMVDNGDGVKNTLRPANVGMHAHDAGVFCLSSGRCGSPMPDPA